MEAETTTAISSVKEIITEARARGLWGIELTNEYPWLQSGQQCIEHCKLGWDRCRQPAYGISRRYYYHEKKARGLIQ